jgi:hypothetical protein
MKTAKRLVVLWFILTVLASAWGVSAGKRDPLTEAEADQLREARMEPYKRLKLFIKFTQARFDSIAQLRADPKQADGRGKQIHDLLEDVTSLLDEINSNLDTYEGERMEKDTRKQFIKGLREVMAACDSWDAKFKALKTAEETDAQTRREAQDYMFVFQDAQDALKTTTDIARQYAEESDADKPAAKKK